jgi:hypothetical protein
MESSPKYIKQVHTWVEACDRLHGESCRPDPNPKNLPQDAPMWLIDTHQYCIVPGLDAHRYVALSYVWLENRTELQSSPVIHTLFLNSSNIANFRKPQSLLRKDISDSVPQVIRHAMDFTRALGARLLWVDRLCIVQNDLGPNGTLSQIAKMDKIYAGAWLTIIAAAPEVMYDRSVTTDWPSFGPVVQPFKRPSWVTETVDVLEIRDTEEREIRTIMISRYGELDQSTWATRGWTYQEQILCKRAVVFVENGLFWHCECCMWDGVDLVPDRNFHRVAVRSQKIETKWWPDFNLYLETICAYNGRDFSYPQDALLGVAGIFSTMLSSFPGGFISGLPRLFLDHALLWQPFSITRRRLDRLDSPVPHSSLPSYSWCGWQCFLEPRSLRSGLSYIGEANCQQHAASWRTRHTVDWNFRTADSPLRKIREPQEFDTCIDVIDIVDNELQPGWARGGSGRANSSASLPSTPGFFHETDQNVLFTHPIPLAKDSNYQNDVTITARLEGSTTTATFSPATTLLEVDMFRYQQCSASFISVFKSQMFELGPGEGKACPVLVLQMPLGGFAGLLQLMNNDIIEKSVPIELIAISKGSATGYDMRQSLSLDYLRDRSKGLQSPLNIPNFWI